MEKGAVRNMLIVGVASAVVFGGVGFASGMAYENNRIKRAFTEAFSGVEEELDSPDSLGATEADPGMTGEASEPLPAHEPANDPVPLGTPSSLGSVSATVNSMDCSVTSWTGSGDYGTTFTPENGKFCVVAVTFENTGTTPYTVDPGAQLIDEEGLAYYTSDEVYDYEVMYSDVNPKTSVDYEFVFDVTDDTEGAEIDIKETAYLTDPVRFSLN